MNFLNSNRSVFNSVSSVNTYMYMSIVTKGKVTEHGGDP